MAIEFPTFDEVDRLTPPGRRGYIEARGAVSAYPAGATGRDDRVASVLKDVADYYTNDDLQPPLPDDLGGVLIRAAMLVPEGSHNPRKGFTPSIAAGILELVVEHGYTAT